jgi:23S rRNA pseudouridine1911/1915/1917 synthase
MVVHPANGNPDGTLVNALMSICKDSLSGIGGEIRPGIVHRLDKDTSGVLIVAKNDKAHINMSEQIKKRSVEKTYIALVRGELTDSEATINMPIARSQKDRKKMAVDKTGKEAITHFKVLKRYNKYTLLEVKIDTGRTHQIRVHLSEIGYPIVGDLTYSNGKNEFGISGQLLHAKILEFEHPVTNKRLHLTILPNRYGIRVRLLFDHDEDNGNIEYYKIDLPDDIYGVRVSYEDKEEKNYKFIDWDGGDGYSIGDVLFGWKIIKIFFEKDKGYFLVVEKT